MCFRDDAPTSPWVWVLIKVLMSENADLNDFGACCKWNYVQAQVRLNIKRFISLLPLSNRRTWHVVLGSHTAMTTILWFVTWVVVLDSGSYIGCPWHSLPDWHQFMGAKSKIQSQYNICLNQDLQFSTSFSTWGAKEEGCRCLCPTPGFPSYSSGNLGA